MALSKALEELVALIADDNDRASMRAVLEKHKPLQERMQADREGGLRQDDYDRNLNSMKSEREKEKAAVAKAQADMQAMQKWWDSTTATLRWDGKTQTFGIVEDLRKKNKELEDRVRTAAAEGTNGTGTTDQEAITRMVSDALQGREYVSKSEIDSLVAQAANKLLESERKAFFDQTLPATTEFIETLNDIRWKHYNEFKEPLDRQKFNQFWQGLGEEGRNMHPSKIHDQFVAKQREEAAKTREAEERKKKEAEWEKDWRSKRSVPGTGIVGEEALGSPVRAHLITPAKPNGNEKPAEEPVIAPPRLASSRDIRSATEKAIAELEAGR